MSYKALAIYIYKNVANMSGIVGLERECFLDAILESGIKRVPLKQTFTERMQYF